MGKVKQMLEEAIYQRCTCPPGVNGMDKLCPSCLAEYEESMVANWEALEEGKLVMTEAQHERELVECAKCDGRGYFSFNVPIGPEDFDVETADCDECNGTGHEQGDNHGN